ncbi:hypothetical protein ONS95_014942 [Cadophora gregata]|uniref:uncharacterized protein n=1 Tax=Cadophora gregata TaxID=51156 RepID=UPI0026DAEED1|nr:uncharacterized protein ONS95_014942 [Cadophora gregata]KAK0103142.1 hypothetical protein ONS96_005751 [Cadophora gregata f. sp. sojae]KAK0113246.1 hypothetical protein ONS95_014942 [Cadophora gregata]
MAPPQPSLNPPMVLPSLPKPAELKLAAKSVSDSMVAAAGRGPRHAPAVFFVVVVLGLVSWYVRRVRGQKASKNYVDVGRQWSTMTTKQKMRSD